MKLWSCDIDVDQRRQVSPDPADPLGQQAHPFRSPGSTIEATATLATARKRRTQMKAASGEGTRRRSSHSSSGTRAIAITKAAVTGRKNSAPARSAKGSARQQAGARDQRDRGEQPVAPIGGALGLGLERAARHPSRSGSAPHSSHRIMPEAKRAEKRIDEDGAPARLGRALLAELDFESSASTNSATGAQKGRSL